MARLNPALVELIRRGHVGELGQRHGRTKPFTFMRVDGAEFGVAEYHLALKHVEDNPIKTVLPAPVAMSPEEFATFSRLAIPELMQKLYMMAKVSEDPKVVLSVLKEFGDRGYGKAVQSLEVNLGPDVRGAWEQIEKFDRPMITQGEEVIIEEETAIQEVLEDVQDD